MSVKLATFVVATLLLAQAFGAEQLFGIGQPVAVIRLSMDDDNSDMQSPISSEIPDLFNLPEPPSAPAPFFAPDLFSSFFRNLFDDAPSMNDEEEQQQGPTIIRVSITSSSDDGSAESSSTTTVQSFGDEQQQQAEEEENPMARFSTVFQRMASMIEDIRGRAMSQLEDQSSSESAPVRRNCALLRACADEIDQLCSTERLTNIAGAISMCLTNHREELGDQCRAVLDKRTGAAGDDDEEEEQADENADEGDLNSSVVITPIDEPGLELPSTDLKADDGMIEPEYQSEDADADAEAEEEEPLPAAELEQPDELPAEQPAAPLEDAPLEAEPAAPAPTPAPVAAPAPEVDDSERPCKADVDTLCATEKANIAETHLVGVMACLHRHQSQLSAQCLAALNPTAAFHCAEDAERLCPGIRGRQHIARCLHTKADLVSDECKQAAHKHGAANNMRFASQSVPDATVDTTTGPITDANEGFRVAPVSTDSEELPAHVWPLAVAGGCFVFIVSLVAVLVYRRRRMQQELPITITLNNPSQSSATLSAEPLPYSPRVQERL